MRDDDDNDSCDHHRGGESMIFIQGLLPPRLWSLLRLDVLEATEWFSEDRELVDEAKEGLKYLREMREMGTRRVAAVEEVVIVVWVTTDEGDEERFTC